MVEINFAKIEKKWQKKWEQRKIFEVNREEGKKKFFMIFAYPGISGYQHVGHMRGYSYTDIVCRYKRMSGFNIMFPAGTHASGNQAIAFANKVKHGDKTWIEYLRMNGCSDKIIKTLITPEKIVKYFNKVYGDFWKRFGFSYDERRFTSTIYPDYQKFIQWQFKKLKDNNLLVQKPYFATACPNCGPVAVDASETDISQGGNAEKQDFIWIKFKVKDSDLILMAGTTRPDALYGQTHLWIDPKGKYVVVQVGGEKWVVGKEVVEKIKYQYKDYKIIRDINPKELMGQWARGPLVDYDTYIVPAWFIDSGVGSGIVYSALEDPVDLFELKKIHSNMKMLDRFALDKKVIAKLKPIPIISVSGMGDNLGEDIGKEFGIKSPDEKEKVELAKGELNKRVFRKGVMKQNCGACAGMSVPDCQEYLKEHLVKDREAVMFYELSEEVICRCKEKVVIKRIDDQWFIKYSDKKLTEESKKHTDTMSIFPKQYKKNISGVLDWFQDRACARLGNWIGTKLEFDKKWTVEPISDSTLYPIYYLVSLYYNQGKIKLEEMDESFFDYVYLGKGKAKNKTWDEIKKEVEYWYPLDVNLGGKEHQTVHFPVFVMNHVGILPKRMWPKGIFVNYWVLGKGSKISKSKGGAQPIPEAIKNFGVDAMRLYYSHIASPEVDVIWDEKIVADYKKNLEKIYNLIMKASEKKGKGKSKKEDLLLFELNKELKVIGESISSFDLRTAANSAFFLLFGKLKKYLQSGGENHEIIKEFLSSWLRVMAPFCPHIIEELWEKIGNKDFVSISEWPKFDDKKINKNFGKKENLSDKLVEDVLMVVNLVKEKGQKVSKIYVYVMPQEKNNFIKSLEVIKKRVGIDLDIFAVNDQKKYDPENKSKNAKPGKPGIYLE
ncbi:leucine--tRNA ligase [archaeon]|jgi:leucyl-tRNA synthetase|nr:leucine--tRNA ligase [archaeon]MBT4373774.1 leucine--tRNA ligase [archaeon]MBT4532240.1 leucine--tRNA ligase [archaeon]MBT7001065.1 leucine--tRNA ligase [archaeon]MBT7281954.1 leucine--tRNA ligase [archaeon]